MSLSLNGSTEHSTLSFNQNHEILCMADIKAPKGGGSSTRAPVEMVAVIDKSISMGNDLELVKQTLEFMISQLTKEDQFSVVSFGSFSKVELQLTFLTDSAKVFAKKAINKVTCDGCTHLSAGIFDAIEQLTRSQNKNAVKSILLFTDGQANFGITAVEELVTETRSRFTNKKISAGLYCFGYGTSHEETMLRRLSDEFHGMYYYVRNREDIKVSFADCLGGILTTVGASLRLEIHPCEGVELREVLGKNTPSKVDGAWHITIGDIYAEESKNIPFKIRLPKVTDPNPHQKIFRLTLRYVDLVKSTPLKVESDVSIARVEPSEVPADPTPNSTALDEHRNRILVAEALDKATQFCNSGNHAEAAKKIRGTIDALQISISSNSNFTQSLIADLKATLSNMTGQPHHATKYMYSLARALYTQRSSGLTSASADAFVTSGQRSMVGAAGGKSSTSAFFANTSTVIEASTKTVKATVKSTVVPDKDAPKPIQATVPTKEKKADTIVLDEGEDQTPLVGTLDPNSTVPPQRRSRAIRRLMQDLKEIEENPLRTVVARPLMHDLFEWHCNVLAPQNSPYSGIIFHLIMQFSPMYPFKPPTLFFCSFIEHPHVFGSWVCLDMLQEAQFSNATEIDRPYTGWSSAYSVLSILLQLQAFLFDEAGRDASSVEKARISASRFKCQTSGHTMAIPWPEFPSEEEIESATEDYLSLFSAKKKLLNPVSTSTVQPSVTAAPPIAQKIVLEEFPSLAEGVTASKTASTSTITTINSATVPTTTTTTTSTTPTENVRTPWAANQNPRIQRFPKNFVQPSQTQPQQPQQPQQTQQTQQKGSTLQTKPQKNLALPTVQEKQREEKQKKIEKKLQKQQEEWTTVNRSNNSKKKKFGTNNIEDPSTNDAKNSNTKANNSKIVSNPSEAMYNSYGILDQTNSIGKNVQQPEQKQTEQQQKKPEPNHQHNKSNQPNPSIVDSQKQHQQQIPRKKLSEQQQPKQRLVDIQTIAKKPTPSFVDSQKIMTTQKKIQQPQQKQPQQPQQKSSKNNWQKIQQRTKVQQNNSQNNSQHNHNNTQQTSSLQKKYASEFRNCDAASPLYNDLILSLKQNSNATGISTSFFDYVSEEVILLIFSFLRVDDLNSISSVCREFCRISGDKWLWNSLFAQRYRSVYTKNLQYLNIQNWKYIFQQEQAIALHGLLCFHSKATFRDDILGIPVSVNRQNARFPELTSKLDFLSWEAFSEDSVRKTVWGEKFTHFLPVWINKEHGSRAFPYIEKAIAQLTLANNPKFSPVMALQIIPRLMNSMVVSVMSGNIHASVKALEGYCMFHRILIEFVTRYPELRTSVNNKARQFISDDSYRHKSSTPNLGEFLPLIAVSSEFTWDDIALPYLEENLTRNVLWAIKKHPRLANISRYRQGQVDVQRLKQTLSASLVSLRLLAFHVFFFRNFARPPGVSMSEIANNYDIFYGLPSTEMKNVLQRKVFEILKITTWPNFFAAIGVALPSQANLTNWLVQSVVSSEIKGYHKKQ